ncbi:hypothetical protein M413DRAFT_443277 [Hebeloma cylindrosporum]|uniref:Uncharacterized protein n=1 Tax=Hebeloma cylindrosporum TaxID=76867 RepID=A0A0C2Y343_HEBCY|nr:hypothetical protein M413DRAFT_443277 [Hebeloma cylindrosporum h7]
MEGTTKIVSQTHPKGELEAAPGQLIYIRICKALLRLIPSTVATNTSITPEAPGHLYLIEGTYEDIQRFAGTTVDWIIRVAHLLCDPLGEGQVYTHTTGTSSDWYSLDRTSNWRQVVQGDPLLPGIYEFESLAGPILLSKICQREMHSMTSLGQKDISATFGQHINLREGAACAVTEMTASLIASRLIPKRMGSDGAKDVAAKFSGPEAALDIHTFDPRIGILLFSPLYPLVDHYKLGFYHVQDNNYILHNFDNPDMTIIGLPRVGILENIPLPDLHLHPLTLIARNPVAPMPPPGIFNWHYMQCVIELFGTPQYKKFPNIKYFIHPFNTAADIADDEYMYEDDDETEPPYPSYRFDRYLAEQGRRQMALERHEEMVQWSSGIPHGNFESPSE